MCVDHMKNNWSSLRIIHIYKAGMCVHHTKNNWWSLLTIHIRLVCVFITQRITGVVY